MSDAVATGEHILTELLGSPARAKVLACLLLPGATPAHAREIERRSGVSYGQVHRQLQLLEGLGLITSERVGNVKRYAVANVSLMPSLRDLVRRTMGVVPLLSTALDRDDVLLALIFGSVASQTDYPDSDIDVLVVANVADEEDDMELSGVFGDLSRETGRDINPVIYRPDEFRDKLARGQSFLTSVVAGPKVFLKGDDDALRGAAAGEADTPAGG